MIWSFQIWPIWYGDFSRIFFRNGPAYDSYDMRALIPRLGFFRYGIFIPGFWFCRYGDFYLEILMIIEGWFEVSRYGDFSWNLVFPDMTQHMGIFIRGFGFFSYEDFFPRFIFSDIGIFIPGFGFYRYGDFFPGIKLELLGYPTEYGWLSREVEDKNM